MIAHTLSSTLLAVAWLATVSVVAAPPANDNFASRVTIAGESGATAGTTVDATGEPGEEPLLGIPDATNTVWWQWTAPRDGYYTFATFGSTFNSVMAVYDGESMARLVLLASNNDPEMYGLVITLHAAVVVPARAGQTLQICIAGHGVLNEGAVALSWYRTTPHWFETERVVTARHHSVQCIPSGEALSWYVQSYQHLYLGTNRSGMVVRRTYENSLVQDLRLDDRKNRQQFLLPSIHGLAYPHAVLNFDGKYVIVGEQLGEWLLDERWDLHAYKIKGNTLVLRNSQTVTNRPLVVARLGGDMLAWCLDFARMPYGSFTGMQRTLKRRRWAIPYGNSFLLGAFGNGMLVTLADTFPTADVEFWKRGRLKQSHRLPALASGYYYVTMPDRRGGVLYCAGRNGTNMPMTYVDKKGRQVFTGFLATDFDTFTFGRLTPRLLLLMGAEGGNGRFQTYRFGRAPRLLGDRLIAQGVSAHISGAEVHVYIEGGGTAGIRAYDKKLQRVKWENIAAGYYTYAVGRKTYCRVDSNTTSRTFTVFRKTKTIATHTYAVP